MCFLKSTIKIGVSANFVLFLIFGVQKVGSISGPQLGQKVGHIWAHGFLGTCGSLIDPRLLFSKCLAHLLTQQRANVAHLLTLQQMQINKCIYIYIYAVGSITWPFFGQSRVNNLAIFGSITWPPFFEPIKIGVLEGDFLCTVFRGWCKISVFEKIGQKRGFRKKKCAPFFWGVLALLPCCCMMSLDALEGCAKNL